VDYRIGKPGSPDFSCGVTLAPLRGQKSAFTATSAAAAVGRPCAKLSSAQASRAATAQPVSAPMTASVPISHPPDTAPIEALRHRSFDRSALTATQHCTTRRQKKRGVSPLG
jgi:hypothetical protein